MRFATVLLAGLVGLTGLGGLAGCGTKSEDSHDTEPATHTSPTSTGPPTVESRCGGPVATTAFLTLTAPDGAELTAVEAGTASRGLVFVNERGSQGLCGWWPYASYLAGLGFHVLLFDHRSTGTSDLMADIAAAVARLRADGATTIALVGGSQGASEALIAATTIAPAVAGVVALSADELAVPLAEPPYPATAVAAAGRLRVPVLAAVSANDRSVSVPDTDALVRSVASPDKRLEVLPANAGHGWDLVGGYGERTAFGDTVAAFLGRVTN